MKTTKTTQIVVERGDNITLLMEVPSRITVMTAVGTAGLELTATSKSGTDQPTINAIKARLWGQQLVVYSPEKDTPRLFPIVATTHEQAVANSRIASDVEFEVQTQH